MIPWEAWFTVLLPCFYRAWLCKWSWWRPQPRVTELSGTAADLQRRLESLGHTHAFLTCSREGLPEAPAELSQSSSSSPHWRKRKFLRPQLLSPDLAIQKALWGCEDHGQAHLWVVNEDEAREEERVALSDVAGIVHSQSHTRLIHCSFRSAHSFFMPYFSLSHQPVPPRSNEGNDGLHTTLRFIRASFTHSPFMGSKWAPEAPVYEDGPA